MQLTGEVLIKAVEEREWMNKETGEIMPLRRVHVFGLGGAATDLELSVPKDRLQLMEKARKLLFQKVPVVIDLRKTKSNFTVTELLDIPTK